MIKYKELREHLLHDSADELSAYINDNLIVQTYLPIGKKYAMLDIFASSFSYTISDLIEDDASSLSDLLMEYEMKKVFDILFRYINTEFDYTYYNSMEYDLIMQTGLYDYILAYCKNDYDKICLDLDVVTGIRDISILDLFNKKLNIPSVEDIKQMKNIVDDLDDEKINKLVKIADMNSPLNSAIADVIKADTYSDVIKQAKEYNLKVVKDNGKS